MSAHPAGTQPALSREACRSYLDETTFRLRPKDYKEKYPNWPGAVGLEIEMQPVRATLNAQGVPSQVTLQGALGSDTSVGILRAEAARRGWQSEETPDDHGEALLLRLELGGGDNISFEPGGQVEFSSAPYPCLGDSVARMREVQGWLDTAFKAHGVQFVQVGINPWHTIPEIGLQMRKGRYRAMDQYFSQIGEYGQRMMRQTCTLQVNLDFGPDEKTMVRRYLASQLLAPIVAATFAYSPIVDRRSQGVSSFRTRIWRHTDPTHTGLPSMARLSGLSAEQLRTQCPSRQDCIDDYFAFAMQAHVVFVAALDYRVLAKPVTFGDWVESGIDGVRPTQDDLATHLSLLFPEVRPRGFLELRSIDCQPRAFEAVPAAYMTGLLYDDQTLDKVLSLLMPKRGDIAALLTRAEAGLSEATLAATAKAVMQLAQTGFAALPACFRKGGIDTELAAFADSFTARGRTPADDVLSLLSAHGQPYLPLAGYEELEARWAAAARQGAS